jgi:cell shape-determining protein MreD
LQFLACIIVNLAQSQPCKNQAQFLCNLLQKSVLICVLLTLLKSIVFGIIKTVKEELFNFERSYKK